MAVIQPYKIAVPQDKLDILKKKLNIVTFPDELDDAEWSRGSPLADIKRLAAYWRDSYDWRKAEAQLNEFPQFTTDIAVDGYETFKIHFIHQKSEVKNAIPLIFVHGWPGSFDEVSKILPELVRGGKDTPAFHVVSPSLVNFGFSEGTKKKGFRQRHHAEVCNKLMLALGYNEYVTQGGDFGYGVTRLMAYFYPKFCRGTHTNCARPNPPTMASNPALFLESQATPLTEAEKKGEARSKWFVDEGMGYYGQHSTKPQTLGYSLADSPVGLLAWVYEKLHDWTDSYPWTDDEIITWISIYQFSTAGPAATLRGYYEMKNDPDDDRAKMAKYIPDVFLGTAQFPKELVQFPKLWNKSMGPLVLASEYDRGGHFAAWERPDAIVKDLREMFGKGGGAFGCVEGKDGYE